MVLFVIFFAGFFTKQTSAQSASLVSLLSGVRTSFKANISYFVNGNLTHQGKISYSYPNKLYINFSNGDEIVSNGKYLWLYDSESLLCAKQEVSGNSFVLSLGKNRSEVNGNRIVVFSGNEKITVVVKDKLPQSISFQQSGANTLNKNSGVRISFSNFQTGVQINQSLFYYKPPTSAQVIENPFKKLRSK